VVSPAKSEILSTRFGLEIVCTRTIADGDCSADTLLIAGTAGPFDRAPQLELLDWIRYMAPRVRRLGSVCTGAFYLASAGLLDGRKATTHWQYCKELATRFPAVTVLTDPIFVRDGNIYTSAGITAGVDLALALVEEDCGHRLSLEVARELVVYIRRSASQSQLSAALGQQVADHIAIRELQQWIVDHLNEPLTVDRLAEMANMSPRNFARQFTREVGVTPARFVDGLRVDAARRRLEEAADPVEAVAAQVGFRTAQSMRRSFLRHLRIAPADYRRRTRPTTIQ
jgi:transcriptional regulator GlxA family with amidase domain